MKRQVCTFVLVLLGLCTGLAQTPDHSLQFKSSFGVSFRCSLLPNFCQLESAATEGVSLAGAADISLGVNLDPLSSSTSCDCAIALSLTLIWSLPEGWRVEVPVEASYSISLFNPLTSDWSFTGGGRVIRVPNRKADAYVELGISVNDFVKNETVVYLTIQSDYKPDKDAEDFQLYQGFKFLSVFPLRGNVYVGTEFPLNLETALIPVASLTGGGLNLDQLWLQGELTVGNVCDDRQTFFCAAITLKLNYRFPK